MSARTVDLLCRCQATVKLGRFRRSYCFKRPDHDGPHSFDKPHGGSAASQKVL